MCDLHVQRSTLERLHRSNAAAREITTSHCFATLIREIGKADRSGYPRAPGKRLGHAAPSFAGKELAARSLVVFGSDTVADDWHHRITPSKIIALAMKRLEARGKGILLLHDIHPVTVAALPGVLKELKEKRFRVVQVVAAAPSQF
jgi:peptidoglycan/xylan/chitin deacetylase (PgdA/CDA1 family)